MKMHIEINKLLTSERCNFTIFSDWLEKLSAIYWRSPILGRSLSVGQVPFPGVWSFSHPPGLLDI